MKNQGKHNSNKEEVGKRRPTSFDKVLRKLSIDENKEYNSLLSHGEHDARNNKILFGQEALDKVLDFQNRMVKKYSGMGVSENYHYLKGFLDGYGADDDALPEGFKDINEVQERMWNIRPNLPGLIEDIRKLNKPVWFQPSTGEFLFRDKVVTHDMIKPLIDFNILIPTGMATREGEKMVRYSLKKRYE